MALVSARNRHIMIGDLLDRRREFLLLECPCLRVVTLEVVQR